MCFLRQDANATESPHGDKVKLTVIAHSVRLSGAEHTWGHTICLAIFGAAVLI